MKPFTLKIVILGLIALFSLSRGQTPPVSVPLDVYAGVGSVLLVWSNPDNFQPVSVTVFRATDLFAPYEMIFSSSDRLYRYLDREVELGQRYFYYITMEDMEGTVFTSPVDTPPFAKPVSEKVDAAEHPGFDRLALEPDSTSLEVFERALLDVSLSAYFTKTDTGIHRQVVTSILDSNLTTPFAWLEWIPIRMLDEYQFVTTDTFNYHIQQMLTDQWDREEPKYRNKFYFTPSEWDAERDTLLQQVERSLAWLQDSYQQEWELVKTLSPVVIYGQGWTVEDEPVLYLVFPHDDFLETPVLFKGDADSLYYDGTLRADTLSPQPVVLPPGWSTVELWLDNELIQKVPLVKPSSRLMVTLDGQYLVGDSTLNLVPRASLHQNDFSLNEVDFWKDASQLAVEIAGRTDSPSGYRMVLDDEVLQQFYPPYTFQTLFLDSTWTIESSEAQIRWLHLDHQTPTGNWERLESRPIYTDRNYYQSRIPDGGPWIEVTYTTLGQSNDLSKTTSPQINIPDVFALYQNYPNPFNAFTTITFDLLQPAIVTLFVTDARGRKVNVFLDKIWLEKGTYNYIWRGEHYSSGIYFITLQAQVGDYLPIIFSRKMVYLK